jgi:hypothetical protein
MNPQPEPIVESAGSPIPPTESRDCPDLCVSENGTVPLDAAQADRRGRSDRRQEPTSPWAALPPAGQRMRNRRAEEHRRPYYTDRFSPAVFAGVMMLIVATLVDAGLTVHVLYGGGVEVNPVMGLLLNHGIEAFVIGKYLLTVFGLPVLLIFRNHYLFGTRLRVGHLIPASLVMYAVVIVYQIVLIERHIGW